MRNAGKSIAIFSKVAILGCSFILFSLYGLVNYNYHFVNETSQNQPLTLWGTDYGTVKLIGEDQTSPEYILYILHPTDTKNPEITKILNSLIDDQINNFKNEAKKHKTDPPLKRHDLRIIPEVDFASDEIISLRLDIDTYWADKGLLRRSMGMTYDRKNNKRLNVHDFLDEKQLRLRLPEYNSENNNFTILPQFSTRLVQDNSQFIDVSMQEQDSLKNGAKLAYNNYPDHVSAYQFGQLLKRLKRKEISINKIEKIDCKLERCIALTYDDGPHPEYTNKILDILDAHNARATFYIIGSKVKTNADIVARIHSSGNGIGNHTWNHLDLRKLKDPQIIQQINDTQNAVTQVTGQEPTTFRPPYGDRNISVDKNIKLPIVLWNVDCAEWKKDVSYQMLIDCALGHASPGAIILMHDIHENTVQATEAIVNGLQVVGYQLVTVDELLGTTKDSRGIFFHQ